ncbi:Na(+)/H(+) antiporter subunit D [Halobacterium sp. R2-5]|uniref:Na(+)/H(+) antiporter subunit D n=1 Tax=Halobacterium sp. R2-5 TaxID=2715751 RepID=UPI00141E66E3|nr:Na(+)/H(+) antiporter subunit D [Halobacterium sp. R2-5]NIB99003.1 Na(+)/H(+) antiporter subunit D [Halobacterium sp. R2-5]
MAPIVPPFVPILLAAILLPIVGRRAGHAFGVLATVAIIPYVWLVPEGAYFPVQLFGFDAYLFNVDAFSRIMGLSYGVIGSAGALYSYASDADAMQTAYALGYVGTSAGAVFGGDWLTLIFFWELMAVTSTLLVWHHGGLAVRAGFRYALAHGISGTLLLAAIVWHFVETGTFLFASVPGGPEAAGMAGAVAPLLAVVGIGINGGFVGLHAWIPDTYPRPHIAASVFLSVFTTKTAVYGLYRAFPDGHIAIAFMGGAMAVFGATMALLQNDMRRLLSYHIQSQAGYMVAGVGLSGALATAGAFGHVFNNFLYKSLLFMIAGVVIYRTGEESLKKVGGLASEMPVTTLAFAIAALSIAGFPGFNGFVSKGMVIAAAHYKHIDILWYLLLAGGVGTFLSFIKFGYYAFLHGEYDGDVLDANRGQSVAMLSLSALCVLFGVYPPAMFAVVPFGAELDFHVFTVGHLQEGFGLAAAGVIGFAILKKPLKKIGRVPDVDRLYNPVLFYGTRYFVVGVTELYAAVDRAVVRASKASVAAAKAPDAVVGRLAESDRVSLRADMSASILLVVVVVAVALALLL